MARSRRYSRKRFKRSRRSRRTRRSRRSRRTRRSRRSPKYVYGVGLSTRRYAKLPWFYSEANVEPVLGTVTVKSIRTLGAYDPLMIPGAGQTSAAGWGLYGTYYNHYRVHKCTLKYTIWPAGDVGSGMVTVVQYFDDDGVFSATTWPAIYNDPRYFYKTFNASDATLRRPYTFSRTFTPRKFYGTGYKGDKYSAKTNAVPEDEMFSLCKIFGSDAAPMAHWNYMISVKYWVEFYERKDRVLGVDFLTGEELDIDFDEDGLDDDKHDGDGDPMGLAPTPAPTPALLTPESVETK